MIRQLKKFRKFCTIREKMEYDVVIIGGGPAGLSTAIKLKQLEKINKRPLSVCLLEKGSYIGAHILSGNVFQPTALKELFPEFDQMDNPPPLQQAVTRDSFKYLTQKSAISIPNFLLPKNLNNHDNFIISLSDMTKWLAEQAEDMGVDIFPGFSASEILYKNDQVVGVRTQDFGIGKDGQQKESYMQGMDLIGRQIVLAEGCRGSLSEEIIQKYQLRKDKAPQSYGLGLKEVWQIDDKMYEPGLVEHTVGWPLQKLAYGGSFMYHGSANTVQLGLIVGLDYKNPYLNPYEEFQQWKRHPEVSKYLKNGQCISYGARALNEGSFFSIPKLTFPGGMMVGCSAGFLSITKIKGSHNAMKSGIEAAKAIYDNIDKKEIFEYESLMKNSWTWEELKQERNLKKVFKYGMNAGILYAGLSGHIFKGKEPWNLKNTKTDSECTEKKELHKVIPKNQMIQYPKHDNVLTFDLLTNHQRSGTAHEHDQPAHLKIKPNQQGTPLRSLQEFDGPEQRFCPAKVYEFVEDEKGQKKLQINAQNCLHCKACSIKMVDEYIKWTVPEGNGGPNYNGM